MRRTSYRDALPLAPTTKDIRFATEDPGPTHTDTPALDEYDIGFSQLPAVLPASGAGGGLAGFGGAVSVASGGVPGFFIVDDDNGDGNPRSFPPGCDPESDPECDDDDTETPPVPEPTAALLFGLGFAAVLRRPVTRR